MVSSIISVQFFLLGRSEHVGAFFYSLEGPLIFQGVFPLAVNY